jgi:hypothetical protein
MSLCAWEKLSTECKANIAQSVLLDLFTALCVEARFSARRINTQHPLGQIGNRVTRSAVALRRRCGTLTSTTTTVDRDLSSLPPFPMFFLHLHLHINHYQLESAYPSVAAVCAITTDNNSSPRAMQRSNRAVSDLRLSRPT